MNCARTVRHMKRIVCLFGAFWRQCEILESFGQLEGGIQPLGWPCGVGWNCYSSRDLAAVLGEGLEGARSPNCSGDATTGLHTRESRGPRRGFAGRRGLARIGLAESFGAMHGTLAVDAMEGSHVATDAKERGAHGWWA